VCAVNIRVLLLDSCLRDTHTHTAPPPPSTAGNLFQSLQDTLVAAMNVRKLAMQGDDDDPGDDEWD
jgi:hypothetical protein